MLPISRFQETYKHCRVLNYSVLSGLFRMQNHHLIFIMLRIMKVYSYVTTKARMLELSVVTRTSTKFYSKLSMTRH